jgi:uncharacterized membrane protein HdeD (DUF308 family)
LPAQPEVLRAVYWHAPATGINPGPFDPGQRRRMIRLALLLLGPEVVRRQWRSLVVFGALWGAAGLGACIDGLDGVTYFPLRAFAGLLLLDGLIALLLAPSGMGMQKRLRVVRGVALVVLSALILDTRGTGAFILAMLFGLAFVLDGALRLATVLIVRFRAWPAAVAGAVGELVLGIVVLEPWPTRYAGTVPFCIGVGMILSAWGLLRLAFQVRGLRKEDLLSQLARRPVWLPAAAAAEERQDLVVHVWTPVGTAKEPVPRPIIDRYIGAVDRNGVVSTGHAALEMRPDVYISHYPAVELDRSPANFRTVLRATADNDVPGRFLPSYAAEAAGWCPSTSRVTFRSYDPACVRAYWKSYCGDDTYNLTNRNCSGAVAGALEAAVIGSIGRRRHAWLFFVRLLLSSEFWIACQLRRRAVSMTWTPGLVLDYARALARIVHVTPRRKPPLPQ